MPRCHATGQLAQKQELSAQLRCLLDLATAKFFFVCYILVVVWLGFVFFVVVVLL